VIEDNKRIHAKPDLRAFEMDDLLFRLGDRCRYRALTNLELLGDGAWYLDE